MLLRCIFVLTFRYIQDKAVLPGNAIGLFVKLARENPDEIAHKLGIGYEHIFVDDLQQLTKDEVCNMPRIAVGPKTTL